MSDFYSSRRVLLSFLVCLTPLNVNAETWVSGYGSVALTGEQTLSQCLAAALQMAKTDAFSKVGRETFSSQQIEICSDTADIVNCELHQQTLNNYDGAYIAEIRNENVDNTKSECIASLEADVRVYKSKHDPDFGLEATIEGSKNKRNGEVIEVFGEVSKTAYLSLYIWSPSSSGNQIKLIFPNQFDKKNLVDGKFQIPSTDNSRAYQFYAQFPQDQNSSAISEVLFLLATKSKFKTLGSESFENFYRRLDELGRENWRLEKIGYTILSE